LFKRRNELELYQKAKTIHSNFNLILFDSKCYDISKCHESREFFILEPNYLSNKIISSISQGDFNGEQFNGKKLEFFSVEETIVCLLELLCHGVIMFFGHFF
jgi:flavodoxin